MGRRVVDFWGDVCHPATGANNYDPKIQSIVSIIRIVTY